MLKDYQEKIIALLIKQEVLMAKLYEKFGERFPAQKDFWQKLAKEERKHANWLEQLYDAAQKSVLLFEEGKVKNYAMDFFIKWVEGIIAKVDAGEVNEQQAFFLSLDLERSLIEKNIFCHFEGVTDKAKKILEFLTTETEGHAQLVEEMCKKARASSRSGTGDL